ncbi:MAG: P1 family peptidase [Gammaproteobacteria bacterium]|nr:P1 family peptidase [Gammaproteobacteria bacterium]MBK6583820.1 P1 family peptidase [Gammaproteobacteria bacterium]MBK7169721.1 P1 family peptidase [Gammaproteobacteria bacterium]MBK7522157.1 P1 family peptidase [Gammaproteobacteria bacterium]MBK7727370.1 P1 family peptidase [Gammaproteobacteria bacterium]
MNKNRLSLLVAGTALLCAALAADVQARARDLGIPFEGTPGALDAITDVRGIEVGHHTLISGAANAPDGGPVVRSGVTAILPRGRNNPTDAVFAGWFSQNGNGEMSGTTWVEESGLMYGPVMITNTHSVGVVRDAVIGWALDRFDIDTEDWWSLPVVGETWDGWLNDINGFHVHPEHARLALDGARGGAVAEGNVGGGTGMICYEFKGGIGTASRLVQDESGNYTVGVLVQANFGSREQLLVAGVPVGREIPEEPAYAGLAAKRSDRDMGSIIAVVATDAPLLPHQLKRIARRVSMGIARTGSVASNSSGDIFIAFSTANEGAALASGLPALKMLPNERITPFFEATVYAVEEAIINALVAAETMDGYAGHRAIELPEERLRAVLRTYNRLDE